MIGALRRTLRRYPPLLLATVVAYLAYGLATERGWVVWACVAAAAVGFLLNFAVITANGGFMPAAAGPEGIDPADDLYKPIDGSTRLRYLADWIDAGRWLLSPGDVLLAAAVAGNLGVGLFGRS